MLFIENLYIFFSCVYYRKDATCPGQDHNFHSLAGMGVVRTPALFDPSAFVAAPSLHRRMILDSVTKEMCCAFWFHLRVSFLLMAAQSIFTQVASPLSLLLSFAVCLNSFCLAERFWDLQLRTMVYWPPVCQCVFLVSRLLLVSVAIVVMVLWACLWLEAARVMFPFVRLL